MRRICVVLLATALLGVGAASQTPEHIVVIVNKANPVDGLTMAQLRKILLGQETKWGSGKKIAVLMPPAGQPERDRALKVVCGMNETTFTLHFMHAFNGETADPPKSLGSGIQVRQFVAGSAHAVGIIKGAHVDGSVKVLSIDGNGPGQPAYKLTMK